MSNYYPQVISARFCLDSDRSAMTGSDNTNVYAQPKNQKFILAIQIGYNGKDTLASYFKLRWRQVGGTFADIGGATEIRFSATSAVLVDGTEVTSGTRRTTADPDTTWEQLGQENVNDNLLPDSGTIDLGNDSHTELQFALDPQSAVDGKSYEFELWNLTEGATAGTIECTYGIELNLVQIKNEVMSIVEGTIKKTIGTITDDEFNDQSIGGIWSQDGGTLGLFAEI